MKRASGLVVEAKSMLRHAFRPRLIHGKPLHLMNHRALTNAALETEAVFQQAVPQHPVND